MRFDGESLTQPSRISEEVRRKRPSHAQLALRSLRGLRQVIQPLHVHHAAGLQSTIDGTSRLMQRVTTEGINPGEFNQTVAVALERDLPAIPSDHVFENSPEVMGA